MYCTLLQSINMNFIRWWIIKYFRSKNLLKHKIHKHAIPSERETITLQSTEQTSRFNAQNICSSSNWSSSIKALPDATLQYEWEREQWIHTDSKRCGKDEIDNLHLSLSVINLSYKYVGRDKRWKDNLTDGAKHVNCELLIYMLTKKNNKKINERWGIVVILVHYKVEQVVLRQLN